MPCEVHKTAPILKLMDLGQISIVCIGVSKTLPPPFSGQAPPLPHPPSPLNVKIVQTLSILGNHHLSILLFHEPRPPKGQIFH